MFVRISSGRLKPGQWSGYETRFKDIVESASSIPGLRKRYLIRNIDDSDRGFSVSVWESEAAMRAYEADKVLREKLLKPLEPYFTGEYETVRCEVVFEQDLD